MPANVNNSLEIDCASPSDYTWIHKPARRTRGEPGEIGGWREKNRTGKRQGSVTSFR